MAIEILLEQHKIINSAYVVEFFLFGKSKFLIWISGATTKKNSEDFFLKDKNGKIIILNSIDEINEFNFSDIEVNFEKNKINIDYFFYKLSTINSNFKPTIKFCSNLIVVWNQIEDLARSINIKIEKDSNSDNFYNKIFYGLNIINKKTIRFHPKFSNIEIIQAHNSMKKLFKFILSELPDLLL